MVSGKIALLAGMVASLAPCAPQSDDAQDGAVLEDGPVAATTQMDAADIPEAIRTIALDTVPGMTILAAERKERDGMVFFDVEGTRPDGSEVELDMLEEDGAYRVVEIQRDIAWSDVPEAARAAFEAKSDAFVPERIIEGIQDDNTIIYELFAPGKPDEPSAEVAMRDGVSDVLDERWKY